jgi:hypothetical protein
MILVVLDNQNMKKEVTKIYSEPNIRVAKVLLSDLYTVKSELNAKIPRGIVLTTKAYDSHLEGDPNLRKVIDRLQEVSNQLCSETIDTEKRLLMKEKLKNQCER